jgi:micrococcal nuclease
MKLIQKFLPVILLAGVFFLLARIPLAEKGIELFSNSLAEVSWEWREARKLYEQIAPYITDTKKPGLPEAQDVRENTFTVTNIIDGDTVEGRYNGKIEKLRLIGIDAPETGSPYRTKECFGTEATAHLKQLLHNKSLTVQTDPSQDERDKYARLLGYLITEDQKNIAQQMILAGMAEEYTYKNTYQYQDLFREAEKEAKQNKQGMWADGMCDL